MRLDRRTRWLLIGCAMCALAALLLCAGAYTLEYQPPPGQDPPKVTDWMQGWGSVAGVFAGLLGAVAAGWLLLHERQQAREARRQLADDRAELDERPARNVISAQTSIGIVSGIESVNDYSQLRPRSHPPRRRDRARQRRLGPFVCLM